MHKRGPYEGNQTKSIMQGSHGKILSISGPLNDISPSTPTLSCFHMPPPLSCALRFFLLRHSPAPLHPFSCNHPTTLCARCSRNHIYRQVPCGKLKIFFYLQGWCNNPRLSLVHIELFILGGTQTRLNYRSCNLLVSVWSHSFRVYSSLFLLAIFMLHGVVKTAI